MISFVDRDELGYFMTFQPDKKRPIFNWFYYKEAYAYELVDQFIQEYAIKGVIADPFMGVGTTLLTAKYKGMSSRGVDASPLAVMVSRVKTRDYSKYDLNDIESELSRLMDIKPNPALEWKYELFPPRRAFPPRNFSMYVTLRHEIQNIENELVREFMLVALLSILPQVSFILKDGGVLRIRKDKRVADVRSMFKRKVKRMIRDLREYAPKGPVPRVEHGSAMSVPWDDSSVGGVITSPPYLNNVDYTKVYGLELSVVMPPEEVRKYMLRSFLTSDRVSVEYDETYNFVETRVGKALPPVVYWYFKDMFRVIDDIYRVLENGAPGIIVVGNTVMHGLNIETDRIFGEYVENKFGLDVEILVGNVRYADVPVKGKKPVRESAVVFRK